VLTDLIRELPDVRPPYLVCRKLDRLHRNNLQWEYLQHKLLAAGVEAIVQFPALDGHPELRRIGSPRERARASMEATWASLEKAELKEKLMAARRERAERGLPNGGFPPYGYMRPVPRGPLVVNEEEAAAYRQIIEWVSRVTGRRGPRTASRETAYRRAGARRDGRRRPCARCCSTSRRRG